MRCLHLALFLTLAAGCAPAVSYVPTNQPLRPMSARPVNTVALYTSDRPSRPYKEVAVVKVEARTAWNETSELWSALRERAAEAGCDAVIVNGRADKVQGSSTQSVNSSVSQNQQRGTTTLDTQLQGTSSVNTLEGFWGSCIQWQTQDSAINQALEIAGPTQSTKALQQSPTLEEIKARVIDELLREGISLDRLDASVSLTNARGQRSVTVALIDRSQHEILDFKQVKNLPTDDNAKVAHLVVVVRSLVTSMSESGS